MLELAQGTGHWKKSIHEPSTRASWAATNAANAMCASRLVWIMTRRSGMTSNFPYLPQDGRESCKDASVQNRLKASAAMDASKPTDVRDIASASRPRSCHRLNSRPINPHRINNNLALLMMTIDKPTEAVASPTMASRTLNVL